MDKLEELINVYTPLYIQLENEMEIHSNILEWKLLKEEPGRLHSMGCKESDRPRD